MFFKSFILKQKRKFRVKRETGPLTIGKPFIRGVLIVLVFMLIFAFLTTTAYSETLFRVSGKVLRKGKGVKGAVVSCSRVPNENHDSSDDMGVIDKVTDEEGRYEFSLKRGKYIIVVEPIVIEKGFKELKDPDIPYKFEVKDRNIKNLNLYLYTEEEIIEANRDILEAVPENKPHVKYKWGRIPLHSEKECYEYAKNRYEEDKRRYKNDKRYVSMEGSKMINVMKFYDLRENPVYYSYRIIKKGIEINRYDFFSIGDKIEENFSISSIQMNINDFKRITSLVKTFLFPYKNNIREAIKSFSKKEGCDEKNVVKLKYISPLLLNRYYPMNVPYLMLKTKNTNKINLVVLASGYEMFPIDWSFEKIREWYERKMTLGYIQQVKERQHRPLMEKKK